MHTILPIICGVIIYGLWRGLNFIDPSQSVFPLLKEKPTGWIIYNLPDGLWFYSFLSSILFVWEARISKNLLIWLFIIMLLAIISELFQAFNFIKGTFDWYDLLAYIIALLIFFINFRPISIQLFSTNKSKHNDNT